MRDTHLLSAVLTLTILAAPSNASEHAASATPIAASRTWQGISGNSGALGARPAEGFIANPETWSDLWTAWRGEEPVPEVDFRHSIVLIGTIPGPNRVRMQALRSPNGQVTTRVWGTKKGGPGFGYVLWAVPRDGLQSVNGQPVADPGSGAAAEDSRCSETDS